MQKIIIVTVVIIFTLFTTSCANINNNLTDGSDTHKIRVIRFPEKGKNNTAIEPSGSNATEKITANADIASNTSNNYYVTVTEGDEFYENFQIDNIMHSSDGMPDLHFQLYVPDTYNGNNPYALYTVLPGYGAYYSEGKKVGSNVSGSEKFAINSKSYNEDMIIVAPQLKSYENELTLEEEEQLHAKQVIRLTQHLLNTYNIDNTKMYISGYSRGGEVMSLICTEEPKLYSAALCVSSKWIGDISAITCNHLPVYFVIGENDEFYGSDPFKKTYNEIVSRYKNEDLTDEEISNLVVLDIKNAEYFASGEYDSQHSGSKLFAFDETILKWLVTH